MKKILISLFVCISFLLGNSLVYAGEPYKNETVSLAVDDAYTWLTLQQDSALLDNGERSGFVDSFEDFYGVDQPGTEVFTYDQAIAAIAFLAYGDIERAKLVLDTLKNLQADDGSWVNSYWYNGYWGAELRKHVGPATWVAIAVRNYEEITQDTTTYHDMAIQALDWCLTFQKSNGGVAGGMTTWDSGNGTWTEEVWTGTEHNINLYPTLLYFASNTPSRTTKYETSATLVKHFLDTVVWDSVNHRFYGGFKNNTGLVDPFVPLDVNPWSVLAMGSEYASSLDYIENASGDPITNQGTLQYPRYRYTLSFNDTSETITGYDFDWESDDLTKDSGSGGGVLGADIWIEGTLFMAGAYISIGNEEKGNEILSEVVKKMADAGSLTGGLPYSINGTNNNYWKMLQQNCISSTGWFVIVGMNWNPYLADLLLPGERVSTVDFSLESNQYVSSQQLTLSTSTENSSIYYTIDGTTPTKSSNLYQNPVTISSDMTVKAIAYAPDLNPSSITTKNYLIGQNVKEVTSNYESGIYNTSLQVSLQSSTPNATIYYTTDGSTPTQEDLVYTLPFLIDEGMTIKAIAFRNDLSSSSVSTFVYNIQEPLQTPTYDLNEDDSVFKKLTIHQDTLDGTIYFTIDGQDPTTESMVYQGALYVFQNCTVKALVVSPTKGTSPILTLNIDFTTDQPNLELTETENSLTFTLLENAEWADIHYIVNQNGQLNVRMEKNDDNQNVYTLSNLSIGDTISYSFTYMLPNGATSSEFVSYEFGKSVAQEELPNVTLNLASGEFEQTQTLSITSYDDSIQYFYLFDGDVNVAGFKYDGPIEISSTHQIQFFSKKEGMIDSQVTTILVTIQAPVVVTPPEEEPQASSLAVTLIAISSSLVAVASVTLFVMIKKKKIV